MKQKPKQETLNLNKIELQLDNALAKETKESLTNWLDSKRNKETLEEVNWKILFTKDDTFYNGAKWQQEQDKKMYTEEEVELLIYNLCGTVARLQGITINGNHINTAYKKFKKK